MLKGIILSAGLGTRLRPVTLKVPKPALGFLNLPLIHWTYRFLEGFSLESIVVNTHHLPEQVQTAVQEIPEFAKKTEFTFEARAPLGSGGGIWFARDQLKGASTILVANGDEVMFPIRRQLCERLLKFHQASASYATILTMEHPEAGKQFGAVWTAPSGKVYGFGKDRSRFPADARPLHYVGVMLLDGSVLKDLPEGESNILYDTVTQAIARGEKVVAQVEPLLWFETGNVKDYLSATRTVLDLLNPNVESEYKVAQHSIQNTIAAGPVNQRYFENDRGVRLLVAEPLKPGSLSFEKLIVNLESINGFAVIGANALIGAPVFDSVILPNTEITQSVRNGIF